MAKIKGIDISFYQGSINFKKVATDGIKFAIIRQGYRKTIDSKFLEYVKGCQTNNINVMVYHFIYTNGATIKQNAESTYNNLKKAGLDPTKTWIAADLEYDTWAKNGETCTKAKCTKYTKEYLEALKALGCKKLFIYANTDYYRNYYDWSQLKYPLWLADYNGNPDYSCAIQQYTSSGRVNGINGNVDMDWLFDESMLTNKATTTTTTVKLKTINEIAKEVIDGKWGNGDTRIKKLTEAGYDYQKVQNQVNNILSGTTSSTTSTTITSKTGQITAEDVINVMRGWVGLSRSAGTHKVIIDTYNNYSPLARGYRVTYWDAYCDTTVSAAFIKLNAVNLIGGTECGVENHVAIFKRAGIWEENGSITPKPGDIIVFNWDDGTQPNDGYSDHIGIVEKVSNGTITTIEGNTDGGVVGRKTIPVGWGYIRGYARPKYGTKTSSSVNTTAGAAPTVQTSTQTKTDIKIDYADSFNKNIAKTYTVTTNLNLRAGANLNKKVLTVIPKNQKVQCYGYYTKDWYYVQYKNFTGFCMKKYLK